MNDSQRWMIFAALAFTAALIYLLAPVLMPFLVGATLAYIGDPWVDGLEERKWSRTMAVILVFCAIFLSAILALLILIPMIEKQIGLLVSRLPQYLDALQNHVLPQISAWTGMDLLQLDAAQLKAYLKEQLQDNQGIMSSILSVISKTGFSLLGWLANIVLIPVVTFYLLRDWDILVAHIHELLPRRIEAVVVRLSRDADEVLGAFLRGQVTVMMALGAIYSVGLWLVGLELALLIGMLAGLVSFVPYLGFIVGILVASVAALMQFQEFLPLIYVVMVFGVGQMAEGMLLTPLLVGEKIGLHPVAVIFAVLAGGQLFGFVGVLLALPVAAVAMVLVRYVHQRYMQSDLYHEGGRPRAEEASTTDENGA